MITGVARYDAGPLSRTKAEVLDNGWLRAPAYLTRVGVFEYRREDGSIRREFRSPEEVFKADSLASFALVPLTDGHPAVGRLDAENTATAGVVGSVGDAISREGSYVRGLIIVHDAKARDAVLSGDKAQLSCGYICDFDETPGVWNGIPYDGSQKNIRGNHVALVNKGRAGADVRVRLDSGDACMLEPITEIVSPAGNKIMVKINLDGVEISVDETAAQVIAKAVAAKDAAIAAAKSELDKSSARADQLSEEVKKAGEALKAAQDPAKLRAAIQARVALEKSAGDVLGETKLDEMSDDAIKAAVVKKLSPDANLEGKSPEYVAARFDAAIEAHAKQPSEGLTAARKAIEGEDRSDEAAPKDLAGARERFRKAMHNAHKVSKQ